jgi:hypothetical protein
MFMVLEDMVHIMFASQVDVDAGGFTPYDPGYREQAGATAGVSADM